MERGRSDVGIVKDIISRVGDIFCIAIDIGQASASIEGIVADAGHTIADSDGCQAGASSEGPFVNARHAVWDGNGGQAG